MRNDNQDYKRTPAQLRNIAERKKGGSFGGRVPPPAIPPGTSWWTCPEAEFSTEHRAQLPRITAVRTTYRYAHDEGI